MEQPIMKIKEAIEKFEAVTWINCGYPMKSGEAEETIDAGWIKFGLKQTKLGWRTLEFMSWLVDDMLRAGEQLQFFPTSPPPYLNKPGECLSFVIECFPEDGDMAKRFLKVAKFIDDCRNEYWAGCKSGVK